MKPQAIYVEFSPHYLGPGKLTKAWHVVGRGSRTILGEIKWHAHWRRYVFYPALTHQYLFDARCLDAIAWFLDEQTELQRKEAAKRRLEGRAA